MQKFGLKRRAVERVMPEETIITIRNSGVYKVGSAESIEKEKQMKTAVGHNDFIPLTHLDFVNFT